MNQIFLVFYSECSTANFSMKKTHDNRAFCTAENSSN